jgi:polysaccharide export outer membrane protein
MKTSVLLLLCLAVQTAAQTPAPPGRMDVGVSPGAESLNQPIEKIGNNDLLGINVYDEPELTGTVRVNSEGYIRLPMLTAPIHAAGLYPVDLEKAIIASLTNDKVLVDPIVTISVVEYRSRPIAVVGSVRMPVTFQATGNVTLLDAIARAQGLADNAGPEILVSRKVLDSSGAGTDLIKRVPVKALLAGDDPSLNILLQGGEEIHIPEAGRVYVVGDVKKPGAFYITDGPQSSILKALSQSEGLDTFPSHKAFIYRREGGAQGRSEIPVDLKKILNRKAPDVALMPDDILYIPDRAGTKASLKVIEMSLATATALGAASLYILR